MKGRLNMRNSARLPIRFPVGSKYVLKSHGPFVRRYIEFLQREKAVSCECWERQQIGIVPDQRPAPIGQTFARLSDHLVARASKRRRLGCRPEFCCMVQNVHSLALMSQGIYFGLACADATWLIILRSAATR
jgi:hypothetical protein